MIGRLEAKTVTMTLIRALGHANTCKYRHTLCICHVIPRIRGCTRTYTYTYIYICISTYTCRLARTHTHTYTHTHIHTYTHTSMHNANVVLAQTRIRIMHAHATQMCMRISSLCVSLCVCAYELCVHVCSCSCMYRCYDLDDVYRSGMAFLTTLDQAR